MIRYTAGIKYPKLYQILSVLDTRSRIAVRFVDRNNDVKYVLCEPSIDELNEKLESMEKNMDVYNMQYESSQIISIWCDIQSFAN